MSGKVYLVGAGPGDFKLLTLRALECIEQSEVIVYDRLVNPEILSLAKPNTDLIYVGKASNNHTMSQDEINKVLATKAKEGKIVTRLKGGDPYVFGRGAEEGVYLFEQGISFEVVPGITSAIGGLCYAGIPITHRDYTPSFHVITGHLKDESEERINWQALATMGGTLVFLMGLSNLDKICSNLLAYGLESTTPVAVINWATRAHQKVAVGTLQTIAHEVNQAKLTSPSLIVVGEVVRLRNQLNYFEKRPLFGKKIIITRARAQSSQLKEKLQGLGADVFELPTIEIVPRDTPEIKETMMRLTDYTYIIFCSQNAVTCFFDKLYARGEDARALGRIKVVAVGDATAKKLENYGIRPDFVPAHFTQESIVSLLADKLTKADHVLLPQGNLARDVLSTCLQKYCLVDRLTMYDTQISTHSKEHLKTILKEQKIDYITFTSSSTVRNFIALLDEKDMEKVEKIKAVSIGEITSKTMRTLGLKVYKEAKPFTIDGLVNCLCED